MLKMEFDFILANHFNSWPDKILFFSHLLLAKVLRAEEVKPLIVFATLFMSTSPRKSGSKKQMCSGKIQVRFCN